MSPARRCSRTACGRSAVNTLTYVYADQTAVLGPLATYAEPHAYDLCDAHTERLSAPRGWEVLRLAPDPSRRARRATTCSPWPTPSAKPPGRAPRPRCRRRGGDRPRDGTRRGHLRVLLDRLDAAPAPLGSGAWPTLAATRPTLARIFKAYDVRGTVPDQIDDDLARAPARAFVQVTGAVDRRHRPRHAADLAGAGRRVRRRRDRGRRRRRR